MPVTAGPSRAAPERPRAEPAMRYHRAMKRPAAGALLLAALAAFPYPAPPAAQAQQQPLFTSRIDLVHVGVTVARPGRRPGDRPDARRLRGVRGRPAPGGALLLRRARERRGRDSPAPRAAARHERQHGAQRPLPEDGRDPLPEHAPLRRRHDAGRLRHRGAGGPLRPGGLRPPHRAHPRPAPGGLHGPLRRAGRLSRRRVRAGRPQGPGALHRRRGYAQPPVDPGRAGPAAGLRRDRLRHRLPRATCGRGRGRGSGCAWAS